MSYEFSASTCSSIGGAQDESGTWINWFVNLKGNEFLCCVPVDFIKDRFNLTGLETTVTNYYRSLQRILDFDDPECSEPPADADSEEPAQLYGLIHARFILTARGIDVMLPKYRRGDFGLCPRVYCNGQHMLPLGLSDQCGESHVKVYCPRCNDIYQPRSRCAFLDGAIFGTGFPHMFLMQLPSLRPSPPMESYTPRLYGFRLHKTALRAPGQQQMPSASPEKQRSPNKQDQKNSTSKGQVTPSRLSRCLKYN